ncbi:SDR family oxidoreductase [Amphibacillus cookii]|uniref:SDR family oxidoreductase n=1 Tax=Amphibacillus cookii TaxID=767787 RepID=UPI0019578A73|nr:SDR family oxidoreductase [Amphibacillus cookii]MBM7541096.1 NAD(P)-dependent dehydrogenase (short-subunit alcohol dehydrogenase family) [Amphibacillus cookii]
MLNNYGFDLTGKVAVVTGGGGVLGSYFCKALAKVGAKIAVVDLSQESAQKIADEVIKEGGTALGVASNVLDIDNLKEAKAIIESELGEIDILINGAGGNHPNGTTDDEFYSVDANKQNQNVKTFFDLDPKGMGFVMDLNVMGTILPSQVFGESMAKREGATIINVSSMNAFTPLTKIPAYSGAKAAISNFTQWLATYMSKVGVRVNAIAPGFLITTQNEKLLKNEEGGYTLRAEKILSATPMGRFGEPEELVGAVLFLADDRLSSFVTGVVVPVDGGFSSYSGV